MDILFSIVGLFILVMILFGGVVASIFLARKVGLIKEKLDDENKMGGGILANYSNPLVFRFIIIATLIMVLMIPLGMVESVVFERSNNYTSVQQDIAYTWGARQSLDGVALLIPYTERFDTLETVTDSEGKKSKRNKTVYKQRTAIALPEELNIDLSLAAKERQRSIYKTSVYNSDVAIDGNFKLPNINELSDNIDNIHWHKAWLAVGISGTRAINQSSPLSWGSSNKAIDFEPGTKVTETIANGFHAPLNLKSELNNNLANHDKLYDFSMTLNVNGSEGVYFRPFGKTTTVKIKSDWPHPSFQGSVLPADHAISDTGFTAYWSIPSLARNYPQLWTIENQTFETNELSAGVNLFDSVSLYTKITRAIKYGVMFLVLTFITFLLFELGIKRRLHLVQYGVIGIALSVFYLILLSMSEQAGFLIAYVAAASIIVAMIGLYVFAALRSISRATIIASILSALYGLLFVMLRLEDYALLVGTGLLVGVLGILMYYTRNIGKESQSSEHIEVPQQAS